MQGLLAAGGLGRFLHCGKNLQIASSDKRGGKDAVIIIYKLQVVVTVGRFYNAIKNYK